MWEFHSAHSRSRNLPSDNEKPPWEAGAVAHCGSKDADRGGPRKILLIFVFHFVVRGILLFLTFSMFKYIFIFLFLLFFICLIVFTFYIFIVFLSLLSIFFIFVNLVLIFISELDYKES